MTGQTATGARRTSFRQWPLRRLLEAVFGVLGVVLVVLVALIAGALVRLDQARSDRVERFGPALLATEALAKSYSDQETGIRGFVSSNNEAFLTPYTEGRASEARQDRLLRRLLHGQDEMLARLNAVRAAARTWQQSVAEPAIAATRANGPRATTTTQIERGRVTFDRVRSSLAALQKPVAAARNKAAASLGRSLTLLRVVLAASLALLLLLGLGTWVALRRLVLEPLARFGREVDVVEAGDLAHPVAADSGPAEIGQLAAQVERMRRRIVAEVQRAERARDEAREAQTTVEAQAVDLERSNAELEQFAYVASHDLQEPLRKVASFCQLLERRYKGQLDERGEQYIEFAVDGAKRMQRLINDLLAFSRVGRITTGFGRVDLDEAMAQAERQLGATIEESGATVTHDELPTVEGEGTLLVQLFQNLVGNGIKFHGEQSPRVHVGVRRDGDDWEFTCADNGIGIEPQYADKIFVIFQRLHGRDVYGGTGIGLAMCKKIVEYHGGRMWLDTTVTDGTTFRWTIPVIGAGAASRQSTSDRTNEIPNDERTSDDPVPAGAPD